MPAHYTGFLDLHDTIAAVSTPPGRGGLGVVRLSGAAACEIAASALQLPASHQWRSWRAALAILPDEHGRLVDNVIVTYYAAPRSYTAEDVVEICCHGSPVVLRHCLDLLCRNGARLAEPGEFTLRAFLNGRIDLPQAEAVRDLIEATTLYQARVAAQQAGGSLSRRLRPVKDNLVDLIALLEAGIDFAEDDLPVASGEEILGRITSVETGLRLLADSFAFGKLVHDGLTLAIVGRPNVGKSSLFNRLLDRERAIVTEIPGTTRDTVSEVAALEGIPVKFVDTAGIRDAPDRLESLGVERSYQAMADADLSLVVLDLSETVTPADLELVRRAREQGRFLVVGNKRDLLRRAAYDQPLVEVSALTGEGLDDLRRRCVEAVAPSGFVDQDTGFITSLRHEQRLREAVASLAKAREAAANAIPHEMLLLDLYDALHAVDAVTGATTADDILNRIFSTFCIGK